MRIVFIGSGGIARSHVQGLVKRADVTLVGAYDVAATGRQPLPKSSVDPLQFYR